MNKKIISLVLALVMVLGTFTSVFAAETTDKAEAKKAEAGEKVEKVVGKDNKIQYVIDKKLVEGYEDGDYGLDKNIKRSEITRLLVLANGNEELAKQLQGSMKIYSDVDVKHWANGVISVGTTVPSDANGIAMLAGYPDGSFKPENDVTYAELAKMLVVLVKEDLTADMVKNATWATSWMTWAAQLGILDDVNVVDSDKAAKRADAFTMVYNALYKMKEFKRVPANETRGIVSNLTNSKLTLNQDSDKEYTITGDTVIVDGINERKQIIKVNSLNDLTLYKGSLVRILTNDKNEVTHILELGNPEYLAIGNAYAKAQDNSIWEGVADTTVETNYYENITSLKDTDQDEVDKAYATVTLNGSKTKADYITFRNLEKQDDVKLKVNDKTEVYVANPYNDIMREVKDINEALSLIGFQNYGKDYKIPNVYAGFDTDDHTSAVEGFDSERNTAKVIVFNVVSKDNDGDLYRVINSSSSNFSTTLEDTDGKLYDRDNVLNKANFPLNYGDLLDVIELRGDVITKKIDHSEKKDFPVVRVLEIFDNDEVRVEDRFGNESLLYFGDADIFNADQYKDLEKGDYLQFLPEKEMSRIMDIVSILDDTKETRDLFDKSGSLRNVVEGIEDHTVVGTIKWVGEKQVEIEIESDNWDEGLNNTTRTYKVDEELAELLKDYVGENVKFKAENKNFENDVRAYNFVLNDGKDTKIVKKEETEAADAIAKLEEAAKKGEATNEQKTDAVKVVNDEPSTKKSEELQKRVDAALKLNAEKAVEEFEKLAYDKDIKSTAVNTAKGKADGALSLLGTANEAYPALKQRVKVADTLRSDYNAVKALAIKDLDNTKSEKLDVLAEVKAKVNDVATNGSNVSVELVNAKDSYDTAKDKVTAKVTLTYEGKTMTEEITAEFTAELPE